MGGESRRDAAAPVVLAPEMVEFMAVSVNVLGYLCQ